MNFATWQQGHGSNLGGVTGVGPAGPTSTEGNSPHVVGNASRGPFYTTFRGTSYDPHRGPHVGAGYEGQRVQTGASYDAQKGPTAPTYDAQRGLAASSHNNHGAAYDIQRDEVQRGGATYEAQKGQVSMNNNQPYMPTPSSRAGTSGYEFVHR